MSVSVSSVVAAAVKDLGVAITVVTGFLSVLGFAKELPFVPAADQNWVASAVLVGGLVLKVLNDIKNDLSTASAKKK